MAISNDPDQALDDKVEKFGLEMVLLQEEEVLK